MMKSAPVVLAAAMLVIAMPAAAQDDQNITLQASGNVMVSEGGEFETAPTGTQLDAGNRLMLAEGSIARVIYENNCDVTYDKPGVYTVSSTCTPAAALSQGTNWGAAGIIAGTAVVGAALLDNMDETEAGPPPPVSR